MLRRSVTFVTTEEGYDRFIKECDKLNDERRIMNSRISSSVEPEIFSHEADCIVFGWTNTIWYSELASVKVVENAYQAIKELDFPAERLIIGETWDVVEYESCFGDPRLGVHVQPLCEPEVVIEA